MIQHKRKLEIVLNKYASLEVIIQLKLHLIILWSTIIRLVFYIIFTTITILCSLNNKANNFCSYTSYWQQLDLVIFLYILWTHVRILLPLLLCHSFPIEHNLQTFHFFSSEANNWVSFIRIYILGSHY